jgi:hypothetical protein
MKKSNLNEAVNPNAIPIEIDPAGLAKMDPKTAAELHKASKSGVVSISIKDKQGLFTEDDVLEPEAVITPQDKATIKYLSNVVDDKTGEISQPFTIGAQRYQMVRGMGVDKQIVMAVFCHDETDDDGENIIHSIDEFEKNIAIPMREKLEMESMGEPSLQGANIQMVPETKEDTYEGRKHFLVKKGTNEVRSFSSIKEMLSSGKLEEEDYMGVSEFKKHMNEKMFGSKKRRVEPLNEVTPTGEESDEEMNIKAKKLMDMIKAKLPNVIATIKTPVAQREVIAAFAELIGVPRNGLSNLVTGLKDLAKQPTTPEQPIAESKIITKNQLMESLKPNKVIKTIKIKDIK